MKSKLLELSWRKYKLWWFHGVVISTLDFENTSHMQRMKIRKASYFSTWKARRYVKYPLQNSKRTWFHFRILQLHEVVSQVLSFRHTGSKNDLPPISSFLGSYYSETQEIALSCQHAERAGHCTEKLEAEGERNWGLLLY